MIAEGGQPVGSREMVEFEAVFVRATDMAILVEIDGNEYWLPLSQLGDDSELGEDSGRGEDGSVFVPEWLAAEKGLV